jgi:CRP/FNR family cyclic AMP-dependent transcriptional regulator
MFTTEFEVALAFGAIGALLLVLSNLMKRMVALRVFALGANLFFIVQFAIEHNWLLIGLQVTLLTINCYRLWSLRQLLLSLEQANVATPIKDWLLPQMKKKKFKAGTVLFRKGEPATELYYIQSGSVHSPEIGQGLGAGSLVGEIGMFSEDRVRAATVICVTDCVCYTMTDEAAYLLYIQNPQIGFYLIRLIIQQLQIQLTLRPVPSTL